MGIIPTDPSTNNIAQCSCTSQVVITNVLSSTINVVLPQMIVPENVRGNVIIRTDASIQPDDNTKWPYPDEWAGDGIATKLERLDDIIILQARWMLTLSSG